MKHATYTLSKVDEQVLAMVAAGPQYVLEGNKLTIEYDDEAPCISCGLPIWEASVGGTAVCPWCDTGSSRDGLYSGAPRRKATEQEYQVALATYRAWKAGG